MVLEKIKQGRDMGAGNVGRGEWDGMVVWEGLPK